MISDFHSKYLYPGLFVCGFLLSPFLSMLGMPSAFKVGAGVVIDQDWFRLLSWLICLIFFWAWLAYLGFRLTGHVSGVFIDRRNRYSLSRLQIVAWTGLAIPSIWAAMGNNVARALSVETIPDLVIDWTLISLMGISFTSFVLAPTALQAKAKQEAKPSEANTAKKQVASKEQLDERTILTEGRILTKDSPKWSRLSDLVSGEEVGNAGSIDIARVQMLVFTTVVWLYYAALVFKTMLNEEVSQAIKENPELLESTNLSAMDEIGLIGLIEQLPSFSPTLVSLILVSHAGYLAGKVTPNSSAARSSSTKNLSRSLAMVNRIDSQLHQIEAELKSGSLGPIDEQQFRRLRDQLQSIQRQANLLQPKLDTGEDVSEAVAHLEGQLDAVSERYRLVAAAGAPAPIVDRPSSSLVRELKKELKERGLVQSSLSPGDDWTAQDDAALDEYLQQIDLTREDLHPSLYRALEEVLEII